jgi:hypothetical protein
MANKLTPRTIASRANGALGRGRKSESGLKRSSLNALRHGLLSGTVVLSTESQPRFDLTFDQLATRLRPTDHVESGIILEMAASTWRLRRLWQIETQLMDAAMEAAAMETGAMDQAPPPSAADNNPFPRTAKAFSRLAAGPDLDLIDRYESRLHRIYHRSLINLLLLRNIDRDMIEHEKAEREKKELEATAPEDAESDENKKLPNEARSEQPEQILAVTPEHSDEEKDRLLAYRELRRKHEDPNADQGDSAEANRPERDA